MQMRQQYDQATGHATWTPLATEAFFFFSWRWLTGPCVAYYALRYDVGLERLPKRRFADETNVRGKSRVGE